MWHTRQHAGLAYPTEPPPHPPVPFETALLKLGEETGGLDDCLRLLSDWFAAEHRTVMALLRKAAYPVFTGVAATFIAPLPLLFMGGESAYILTVVTGLAGWAIFGKAALMAVTAWYLNQPKYVLGRLLRSLTIAIEAGLPLGRAVQLAAQATGNAEVLAHVRSQGTRVMTQPLADTFRGCPHVPASAVAAMEVAAASGNYGDTLRRLAALLEG